MAKEQLEGKSNEILWEELRTGNLKAMEALYRFNYQVLYSYAFKICRDKELSKDCVQEFFIHLWEKRENLNKVLKVRAYLLQSIWRILIKKLKKEHRRLSLNEDGLYEIDVVFSREHVLINDQLKEDKKETLNTAIQKLSKHQREIIFMRYYEGLTIDEIQHITELKHQSIKNLIYRAMVSLRESFNIKKK